MSKTKKLPKYITEARMATLLSRIAAAADATFAIRLNAMEERLRDEFGASRILATTDETTYGGGPLPTVTVDEHGVARFDDGSPVSTYEGNHLAPTPAEGAE